MAPREISMFVQDVTSENRVPFATSTMFRAIPICPAVVVPLMITARAMRPVAIAATMRSRTTPNHCWRQASMYAGC